ncbi:MAG: hypothetical protein HKN12_09790 [Gemmatimonadetes bacterium]|nr:hypothetical protein [Gemmatimonadota bacterium]
MKRQLPLLIAPALVAFGFSTASAITVDGSESGEYPSAVATQDNQTNFGDSNIGAVDFANGSEIDEAYGVIGGGSLFLMLGGNLESNYNKLEIFIDSVTGGQNKLRGDNADVDFNGLNRMGDDGSGNGLTFDAGFEADYYMMLTGGDDGGGNYQAFCNFADLPTGGGGVGTFVGGGVGTQFLGQALGISFAINNSNTAGVGAGAGLDNGAGVTTGSEFEIPLSAIGNPSGCVEVIAFINGGSHDFLANQVLGGLGGLDNLGEPRNVNFDSIAGTQSFTVCPGPVPVDQASWGQIKSQYR